VCWPSVPAPRWIDANTLQGGSLHTAVACSAASPGWSRWHLGTVNTLCNSC